MIIKFSTLLARYLLLLSITGLHAQSEPKDLGKDQIGKITTTIYYGTNGELSDYIANQTSKASKEELRRLRGISKINYKHYRKLGHDTRDVLRSYENWASPLNPSEEIMLSFESRGLNSKGGLRLDLELWQHKRKVMKSDPILYTQRPLLIMGPKWRNGKLIIAVELTELSKNP